jgi:hypothetical protein
MVAQFPTQVRVFSNKVDLSTTVMADHVNALQEEVTAIENTLTSDILTSSYTGEFSSSTVWSNLSLRLENIEAGLVNGIEGAPYVRTVGGSIVAPNGVVGITMQPASGTANLFNARSSSSVLGFNIDYNGMPKVGTGNVVYVGGSDYQYLLSLIAAAQATANAAVNSGAMHPFLLSGM